VEELQARERNSPEERREARDTMQLIEDKIRKGEQDIHCLSCRVVDKNGALLIAYFSHSIKIKGKEGRVR
jgi:hypothetical protein